MQSDSFILKFFSCKNSTNLKFISSKKSTILKFISCKISTILKRRITSSKISGQFSFIASMKLLIQNTSRGRENCRRSLHIYFFFCLEGYEVGMKMSCSSRSPGAVVSKKCENRVNLENDFRKMWERFLFFIKRFLNIYGENFGIFE